MSTLSREAREIIAAGKSELVPTQMDRTRVTHLLSDRMSAVALTVPTPAIAAPQVVAGRTLKFLTLGGALRVFGVVGVLGVVAYFGSHGKQSSVPTQNSITAVQPVVMERQPIVQPQLPTQIPEPAVAQSVIDNPAKTEPPQRATKPSRDSLGEEVQILSRAEMELHNGKPALALRTLDEHQRRFSSGALVQERSAARIQALCALGRTQDARAESIKLKRSSPNSPQAAQISSPCESQR